MMVVEALSPVAINPRNRTLFLRLKQVHIRFTRIDIRINCQRVCSIDVSVISEIKSEEARGVEPPIALLIRSPLQQMLSIDSHSVTEVLPVVQLGWGYMPDDSQNLWLREKFVMICYILGSEKRNFKNTLRVVNAEAWKD